MSVKWATAYGWDHLLISTDGQVKSKARLCKRKDGGKGDSQQRNERKIIPGQKDGYLWVNIMIPDSQQKRAYRSVHRLVVETFLRPLVGEEEINHINGIRNDNRLENLEIVESKAEHNKKTWERLQKDWYDRGYRAAEEKYLKELEIVRADRDLFFNSRQALSECNQMLSAQLEAKS